MTGKDKDIEETVRAAILLVSAFWLMGIACFIAGYLLGQP